MKRFDYLAKADGRKQRKQERKVRKAEKKARKAVPIRNTEAVMPVRRAGPDPVSMVYVRSETVQAVWREVKRDGGESVSELVEDLLLAWLRERTR